MVPVFGAHVIDEPPRCPHGMRRAEWLEGSNAWTIARRALSQAQHPADDKAMLGVGGAEAANARWPRRLCVAPLAYHGLPAVGHDAGLVGK